MKENRFIAVKKSKNSDAHIALDKIVKMYVLEKELKKQELSPDQIYEKRLEKSKPLLDELYVWLTEKSKAVLPKGLFGKAIGNGNYLIIPIALMST